MVVGNFLLNIFCTYFNKCFDQLYLLADGGLHVGEELDVDGLGQGVPLVALKLNERNRK